MALCKEGFMATAEKKAETSLMKAVGVADLSGFELATVIESGLPTSSIQVLKDQGLTFGEVHDLILPARTMKHRLEKKQNLTLEEADRTLRVARILELADRVFGDHEKGLGWLRRANRRLSGRSPIEMLKSEVGGDLVRQMLYQIDEGIFV
jgi:putative toxin-antitoxin system antitoxin component (TIGR02293 family)